MLSRGSRFFVGFVFAILGASFIATTALMLYEYRHSDWPGILTFYSHVYIFYATFGLVALAAFYIPCCVFTDMYWKHIPYGRIRFLAGFALLGGLSVAISSMLLAGNERYYWEIAPEALASDRGGQVRCGDDGERSCRRLAVLNALSATREISQSRIGLGPFGRDCRPDPLVELSSNAQAPRWCFVSASMETAASCCRVQDAFAQTMTRLYETPGNRSLSSLVTPVLLPLKIFFLLVLYTVGVLLALRRQRVDTHYETMAKRIETGVLTGAFVMLFWPVMNHAYLQSTAVLYGSHGDSLFRLLGPAFSLMFGGWALMLLFFFHRRYEKSLEAVGKIAGLLASALAILQYENIVNWAERITGSGANSFTIAILVGLGVLALIQLLVRMSSADGRGLSGDLFDDDRAPGNASSKQPLAGASAGSADGIVGAAYADDLPAAPKSAGLDPLR
ncbi:MAG: hypothetical protein AAFQ42_01995 [Pseudomonadota bacterium]